MCVRVCVFRFTNRRFDYYTIQTLEWLLTTVIVLSSGHEHVSSGGAVVLG